MARPGFVLETDDRTPPLVVPDGDGYRLEKLPLGSRVIYPTESLPRVPDLREAVDHALDAPLGSDPLTARLRPGMRLTIAFDDLSTPVPPMRRPDLRGTIIEAVLTRAAQAGVDDVALVSANGLNRHLTPVELERLVGERVFRSFHPEGLLTNHDAEDTDHLTALGGGDGDATVRVNARVAASDLVVLVHLVTGPQGGGAAQVVTGLGSTAAIRSVAGLEGQRSGGAAERAAADVVAGSLEIFAVEAVLDQDVFPGSLAFLGKREWEWSVRDRATWLALRQGFGSTPTWARRRFAAGLESAHHATLVSAGDPAAVQQASQAQIRAQQVVEVDGQTDVGVIGVSSRTPYSVNSLTNPVLAAWSGLAAAFGSHTGRPFVREGGALILFHPLAPDFSPLHHPSSVDFFADVLPRTTDPDQIRAEVEDGYAEEPWYRHLYRTSQAYHGLHPLHLWYELSRARAHCTDIVWVGADRASVERLGFRAASTLADALEIVASSVGRSPSVSYLHAPPRIVTDVR
ncbi:MAG: hypothetical protein JWP61_1498 [Friedmanniella sp.]|nr:hypothetical protein [Friedmanniella sp.]